MKLSNDDRELRLADLLVEYETQLVAGDVSTGNVKSNFYFQQAELVRSVGAVSERTDTPQSARGDLLRGSAGDFPRRVQVLDAQQPAALRLARAQPAADGGDQGAEMQGAGG